VMVAGMKENGGMAKCKVTERKCDRMELSVMKEHGPRANRFGTSGSVLAYQSLKQTHVSTWTPMDNT